MKLHGGSYKEFARPVGVGLEGRAGGGQGSSAEETVGKECMVSKGGVIGLGSGCIGTLEDSEMLRLLKRTKKLCPQGDSPCLTWIVCLAMASRSVPVLQGLQYWQGSGMCELLIKC